jgi:predicted glycoside hydrolase/deacetylase ChbG (UPF0249 family)
VRPRLIVNADDLGMSDNVNREVFRWMEAGSVTSATLMANGPAVEAATKGTRDFPHCSFGVHLVLTQFRPLTRDPRLAFLLDAAGEFNGRRDLVEPWSLLLRPDVLAAIHAEWSAQVACLRALGVEPTHIDSHHHVHTIPALFPVVKRIQAESGIRRLRIPVDLFDGVRHRAGPWVPAKRTVQRWAYRTVVPSATPDHFASLHAFLDLAPRLEFESEIVEVMVHPGNPGTPADDDLLRTHWQARIPFPCDLASYHDLPIPGGPAVVRNPA